MSKNTMKVFFATNRNLEVNSTNEIEQVLSSPQRPRFGIHPHDFRIGTAQVEINLKKKVHGEPIDDNATFYGHAQLAKEICTEDGKYEVRGSDKIFPELIETLRESNGKGQRNGVRCSTLVFIPGFNNSFEESIEGGAFLAHLYSSDDHRLVPFVFSWPSDGEFLPRAYWSDRVDAEISGCAGARLLACFLTFLAELGQSERCSSSAFLIAHSMGAYLLRFAVPKLQKMPTPIAPLFDTTILVAPDVDVDVFNATDKLQPIDQLTKQVLVYVNKDDAALSKARHLHGGSARLGHNGPATTTAEKLAVPLTTIRCHKADFNFEDSYSKHRYYRSSIAVVKDIKAVINGVDPDEISYREKVQDRTDIYRLNPPREYHNRHDPEEEYW